MKRLITVVFIGVLAIALSSCQKQKQSAEQPGAKAAQVKEAITTYVQKNTSPENTFAIKDDVENRTRQLTFGYVHGSVHETEDGRYYACVDFTEAPDDTLDLDFYVTVDSYGASKVSEVVIHKVNGESR